MSAPKIAQKAPYAVDLVAGKKYFWCTCGHSANQPFCDGSHTREKTGMSPQMYECTETKTHWLCGCKQTGNKPLCDGTHNKL